MTETKTKSARGGLFEEVFQNIRKVAEANLSMQQELLSQWSVLWPGLPAPQTAWINQMQKFRSKWVETVSELAREHRDAIDRQYRAAIESLDAALCVTEASTPEEFRRRTEQLCRKSIDCVREIAETQVAEFQDAVTKWTDLVGKSAS